MFPPPFKRHRILWYESFATTIDTIDKMSCRDFLHCGTGTRYREVFTVLVLELVFRVS